MAIVPDDVIGFPETDKPVGTETSTDVTHGKLTFTQLVPLYCNTWDDVGDVNTTPPICDNV